jgi:hypothetical protein
MTYKISSNRINIMNLIVKFKDQFLQKDQMLVNQNEVGEITD